MEVKKVLQDGSLFDPEVLDLSLDAIMDKFRAAVAHQCDLSLGLGYPTTVSASHTLLGGFKNLVAFSAASGYEFPQAQAFLDAAKNAPGGGATTAAAVTSSAAEPEPVEEVPAEEPEDIDMGGLFGEEDDY